MSTEPNGNGTAPARPLPPRQARFVEEYLKDLNASAAAVRAGYSERHRDVIGPRLVGKSRVAAAIQAAKAARAKRTALSQDYVVRWLRRNLQRAMQAVAVTDDEGKETGVYTYNGAVANKSLELLGRHLGMFAEHHDHRHTGSVGIEVTYREESAGDRP